jgi:hypothetical protein
LEHVVEVVGDAAGELAHRVHLLGLGDLLFELALGRRVEGVENPTDHAFQDIMQIKQNANRAASLVRQLLAFSRRQTLRPEVMDVGEALTRHRVAGVDREVHDHLLELVHVGLDRPDLAAVAEIELHALA